MLATSKQTFTCLQKLWALGYEAKVRVTSLLKRLLISRATWFYFQLIIIAITIVGAVEDATTNLQMVEI